ncbi:MAG TPA: hypothetical protein PLO67_06095 [Saprospiraceae bacterium]|nr:hypothetical protein [Saprospiraceae bacterium]HPI05725.1 hypothetical protein [Saprospiraceae bacterium]
MRILIHFFIVIIFGLLLREDPKPVSSTAMDTVPSDSLQMPQVRDSTRLQNSMPSGQEWARR